MRPDSNLASILEEAKALGYLGPETPGRHVDHSLGFVEVLASMPAELVRRPLLDLGSGGGIPGLVIAQIRHPLPTVLLDGSVRRAAWLTSAVERLGLSGSVEVIAERAETAGRRRERRYGFGIAVARLFGKPAVTAECAAPFLGDEGVLVVSEPATRQHEEAVATEDRQETTDPEHSFKIPASLRCASRWPAEGLAELGLAAARLCSARHYAFAVISRLCPCGDRYPRRTGVPAKRPLF